MDNQTKNKLLTLISFFKGFENENEFIELIVENKKATKMGLARKPMDFDILTNNIVNDRYRQIDEALLDFGRIWFNCLLLDTFNEKLNVSVNYFEDLFIKEARNLFSINIDKQKMRYLYTKENFSEDDLSKKNANMSENPTRETLLNLLKSADKEKLNDIIVYMIKLEPNIIKNFNYDEIKLNIESLNKKQLEDVMCKLIKIQ